MRPARGGEPTFVFPDAEAEALAEWEHERWMQAKLQAGWRWAAQTNRALKRHWDLVPWRTLSDAERARRYTPAEAEAIGPGEVPAAEKEKDLNLVRGIPAILAEAGYTIMKVQAPAEGSAKAGDAEA
jgi:hypothetical protein